MKSKLFAVVGLLCSAVGVWAQSSTFTYQGQLSSNGVAATGLFDVRFALYDAVTLGSPVGTALTNSPTDVTNGLFQVTLNFGSSVFDGNSRWLELGVRTNGSTNAFTTMSPRQQITATPYAVRAANYSGPVAAANLTGKINDTNLSVNVALLTNSVTFSGTVTASAFSGNGSLLNNLNANNLASGTVPDARISTNVAFLNTSNTIFKGSITATNFHGEGRGLTNVPGRIFDFVPTAVSQTAYANYGYFATNDMTPVVITLPPTAQIPVGNIVRLTGSGAAGWVVAQNAGQKILTGNLLKVTGGAWRTAIPASSAQWRAVAASGDGQKLVAVVFGGGVYTSSDYGTTWGGGGGTANWSVAAVSGNGAYVFTATSPGVLGSYTKNWSGLACSVDGHYVVACANGENLYRSSDYGVSWGLMVNTPRNWTGISSSGDGVNLAACVNGGNIWVSTNSGSSWTARASIQPWSCIAGAANGGVFVAGFTGGQLYVSYDSGTSWIPTASVQAWTSVSCSADGSRMIASYGGGSGGVFLSQDGGASWQLHGNLTSADFRGVAVSGDGSTAIAAGTATPLYVSSQSSTTVGTAGQLIGSRYASVELEHVGNGVFIPISYVGIIRAK